MATSTRWELVRPPYAERVSSDRAPSAPHATAGATAERLRRASGELATAAAERMERTFPWFRALPAKERSWVSVVAGAGIASFIEWYARPEGPPHPGGDIFGGAPRELVRAITMRQTVDLVRTTIEVVEELVDDLAAPGDAETLREAVLRYGREIAFASAVVYAQAAEARGAWDVRLEALVVDALLRGEMDESMLTRAAALGWHNKGDVAVVVGIAPQGDPETVVEELQRATRTLRLDVLAGVHGDRLVGVLGGVTDPLAATRALAENFADGPIVVGPPAADLMGASASADAALAGLAAVRAWPDAPRPVPADDLLVERALNGDARAAQHLIEQVAAPLQGSTLETVRAFLESGSIEGAARALFVHTNTVRYRLKRASELTGEVLTSPRGAHTVRTALALSALRTPQEGP